MHLYYPSIEKWSQNIPGMAAVILPPWHHLEPKSAQKWSLAGGAILKSHPNSFRPSHKNRKTNTWIHISMVIKTWNDGNHLWQNFIWSVINYFLSLAYIPFIYLERGVYDLYCSRPTGMFWLHFSRIVRHTCLQYSENI